MDKVKIINYLEESGFSDVELLSEKKDLFATRFYYDFNKDELKAAEAYSNDGSGKEKNEAWYDEFYIPYLTELAIDNVGEVIEELMSDMDIKAQFISYEMEADSDYSEFISVFYNKEIEVNIEDILANLDI